MNHLTVDEILDFISLSELNAEAIKLSATVNEHIRECEKCLKLVRSFQLIHEEFLRLNRNGDFKKNIDKSILGDIYKSAVEMQMEQDELDNFR